MASLFIDPFPPSPPVKLESGVNRTNPMLKGLERSSCVVIERAASNISRSVWVKTAGLPPLSHEAIE